MNLGLPVSGALVETLHHRLVVKTEKRASGDAWTRERDGQGGTKEGEGWRSGGLMEVWYPRFVFRPTHIIVVALY